MNKKQVMRKIGFILVALCLLAYFGKWAEGQKQEATQSHLAIGQLNKVKLDTALATQLVEDVDADIKILLPAMYRGTEPADFQSMLAEEWYDFYQDSITKEYFLKRADIEIGKFYDGCIDDSTTYVDSRRNSLILIEGIVPKNEAIKTIPIKKRHVWVGETYSFLFNEERYIFRGDGTTVQRGTAWTDDGEERWDEVRDYKLYISKQGGKEQLLVNIPSFNDTFVQILWIGDLDEDGKPDFIIDTSLHYEEKTVLLFLSSKTEKDEIVKLVASSSYQFDC